MSYNSYPLISVIIASFNGQNTLQQCIGSFAQQSYHHKELVIIDGGSTDGSVNLLERNQSILSYWISEADHGIYSAWNKGLVKAKGDWICFLGVDDFFWDGLVLERIARQLEKISPNFLVAYSRIMRLTIEGQILYLDGVPWPKTKWHFNQFMSIPHPAVMHRKSFFEKHGNFDESFHIAGDYELLLRELKTGNAKFIPDIVSVGVRSGGISTVSNNRILALKEIFRAQRIHGRFFPSRFFVKSIINEYFRIAFWKILGNRSAQRLINLRRRLSKLPPYSS